MENVSKHYLNKHKKFRFDKKKLALASIVGALLVALGVFWWLKLVGITITSEAYCNIEEHTHTEECYQEENLCTKAEHTHTPDCVPNTTADVEAVSDWLATIENVKITNNVSENLVGIAQSQLGYKESKDNFQFDPNGVRNGYTRYGEWYGTPYGKWDATFVSFCLHYSNVNNVDPLESASPESMRLAWKDHSAYSPAGKYTPQRGDLVFMDDNKDGSADTVAIILSASNNNLVIISGDNDNQVATSSFDIDDRVLGYGMTDKLGYAKDMNYQSEEPDTKEPIVRGPLMFSTGASKANITYTSDLTNELVEAVFMTKDGEILDENSTVHIGESYTVFLKFQEVNTGNNWIQFDPNQTLTYQIPSNLQCTPFTGHTIKYTDDNGKEEIVGEYSVNEDGLLEVIFYQDKGFLDKFSNVDFTIEFDAVLTTSQSGESTEIKFNDKINVDLNVDSGSRLAVTKEHGEYSYDDHTIEYTVRVESLNGTFNDFFLRDDLYHQNQTLLTDSIRVTDLNGNELNPQPTFTPQVEGFLLSDFPEFSQGEGYILTYKTEVKNEVLTQDKVTMGNYVHAEGTDTTGSTKQDYVGVHFEIEPERIEKTGRQTAVDENGTRIPVVEWQIEVRKHNYDLHGTVVVDTLKTEGLEYYQKIPIKLQRWDENGNKIEPDLSLDWDEVTLTDGSMALELPDGYMFKIIYYTTYPELEDGQHAEFENEVHTTINGEYTDSTGNANVVGFTPYVEKTAYGDDGEYVYFTINTNMPAHIKDEGNFHFTDYMDLGGDLSGYHYIENKPEDMIITAVTESGETITFTPYVPGGPVENTYILQAPKEAYGTEDHHYFDIYFNTSTPTTASSKWLLDELSTLTITYKIPFSARTVNVDGSINGDQTLGDLLEKDGRLSNRVDVFYTTVTQDYAETDYTYNPKIVKSSVANRDGTIDYTVTFENVNPRTGQFFLGPNTQSAFFTDTFDKKLEYVPGSLSVTCYIPWRPDTWQSVYTYQGDVEGNTIHVQTNQFMLTENNADSGLYLDYLPTLHDYYGIDWLAGGRYEFTYKLKIKDEYLLTTEHNLLELLNTAEITWDEDGSTGSVTNKSYYETGLIDKQMVQRNDNLDFTIYVNRNCLDVMKDMDTLTITDVMTENLAVYWDTIQLYYEDGTNNWVNFNDENSQYKCTVNFNQITNTLTFVIPDELHVKIDYSTLVTETGSVSVNNTAAIDGKNHVTDIVDGVFSVTSTGGEATGSLHSFTLMKHDGITHTPLPNVTLHLYGQMAAEIPAPKGVPRIVEMDDGTILYYIGSYTTGEDGTVKVESKYLVAGGPYALLETTPPTGYIVPEKPEFFYFYEPDPNGILQTVTTIIAVHNFQQTFVLPETGGIGTISFGIIGVVLMVIPIVYSIIRRRRERRLT